LRILGPKRDEVTGEWRKLHTEELNDLYTSPNILFNTQFSSTFSLRSSLNVNDQVSHPYKTTGEITVLCVFNLYFWITNWKRTYSAPNEANVA
jgi:hypothetical protein